MIIFTGVAGSGKSMQGRRLADELGLPWVSTGEFLRMLVSGQRRKAMLSGKLMKDSDIIQLARKIFALIDTQEEFILDGFPRTVAQADWLLNQAKHGQLEITAVIHLTAEKDTVLERLMSRGRQDDTEVAISERFKEYEHAILPILKDFKDHGVRVVDVDGNKDVETIHRAILDALKLNDN